MRNFIVILFLFITQAGSSQLSVLAGKVPTEFSKGYEVRAATLQKLITDVENFYETRSPIYKFAARLKVLDSSDWRRLPYKMPYGLPHVRDGLVIGAEKNALFPDQTTDAEISVYDCIAIHELGHYFMGDLVKTDIWPNWANEFIATYFQVCYSIPNNVPSVIPDNGFVPKFRSLEDFERGFGYIGADNYGWYQGQFMKLAHSLYSKHGLMVLNRFIENYQPGGKEIDALVVLNEIDSTTMRSWLDEMK